MTAMWIAGAPVAGSIGAATVVVERVADIFSRVPGSYPSYLIETPDDLEFEVVSICP
jgi:hypothetical protein